jgi:hypothetical protein
MGEQRGWVVEQLGLYDDVVGVDRELHTYNISGIVMSYL